MAPKKAVKKSKKTLTGGSPSSADKDAAAPTSSMPAAVSLISVRYPDGPLSLHHHFGHEGGADTQVPFSYRSQLPVFQDKTPERVETISQASSSTIRTLVTDAKFETLDRQPLQKPTFMYGDSVNIDPLTMYDGNYKWLREIGGRRLFLPNMERMFPISYYQCASIPRSMHWDIACEQDGVQAGQLSFHGTRPAGYSKTMLILKPGLLQKECPAGESPKLAQVFIRKFISVKGEFPAKDFRIPGWVHSSSSGWWARMVNFVMAELRGPVEHSGLGIPILATRYGITPNHYGFFAMLERYNPQTCTFFTPAGELGFALHEMFEVSGLPFGELPYEEFIPGNEELAILKKTSPGVYDTFWEVMCHFHICEQVTGTRGGGIKQGSWADYLFSNLSDKDPEVTRMTPVTPEEVAKRIEKATAHYTNEAREDTFAPLTEFDSFHYQALTPISDMALFAGFLMLWLKRCVVPTRPIEVLVAEVVYPAVLLAYGRPINLLTSMVCCLQGGLRELASEFVQIKKKKSEGVEVLETPCPRVPMPYTYLVSWFVLHCPNLMTTPADGDSSIPFVQRLATAHWNGWYQVIFRQILQKEFQYTVFRCFPEFGGGGYGSTHQDTKGSNSFTTLDGGVFRWLLNIRPGYLVFRQASRCFIEPYQPYRFARQFGYDQIYVGNPHHQLSVIGNVYEGARAWYYSVAGCTGAKFQLPHKLPNSYTSMGFCMWYQSSSQITEYKIYTSCIKQIRKMYHSKRSLKNSRMRGLEEFLSLEQETAKEPETEDAAAVQEQGPTEQGPTITQEQTKKAKGKRPLSAEETSKFGKRTRRKLNVGSPTSQTEQGQKLMHEAIQSGPKIPEIVEETQVRPEPEEEAQESSVAGLPRQFGLRSTGPALAVEASHHPSNEEGGDESDMGDVESAPPTIPSTQQIAEDSTRVGIEKVGGSSSSTLISMPDTHRASPTTGLLPTAESSHESSEKISYGSAGDWDQLPTSSPGKASVHTSASPQGSPIREATPLPDQSKAIIPHSNLQAMVTTLVTTPPLTKSAPLRISLRPDQETGVVSSFPPETFTVPPSSPSTLGISVPSSTPSPAFSTAVTPAITTSVATSSSPASLLKLKNAPDFLQTFIEQLEQLMKLSVKTVVTGQSDFETLRPFLMNSLTNIRCLGDDQCYRLCLEGLARLETGVKAFQDLSCIDLDARIESSFVEVRLEALHHHEVLQKDLAAREKQAASLKARHDQVHNELTSANSAMEATQTRIAQLRTELAQQEAKLSLEEAKVQDLTNKSVETEDAYRKEIQALEEMKKEVIAAAPDEEALKRKLAAKVRTTHAKILADARSNLESITLGGLSI